MATLIEQLTAMRGMKSNWDGYDADAPDGRAIDLAIELVRLFSALRPDFESPAVYVSPTRIGGVQFDWDDAEYDHEFEIEPDGTMEVMHTEKATGRHTTRKFPAGPQPVTPQLLLQLRHLVAA